MTSEVTQADRDFGDRVWGDYCQSALPDCGGEYEGEECAIYAHWFLRTTAIAEANATIARQAEALKVAREALKQIERRLRQHPDDTPEDDRRDKRKAHGIARQALASMENPDGE